jgi:predicted ABC-class ATPase
MIHSTATTPGQDLHDLRRRAQSLDGRGYKAYKSLQGYAFTAGVHRVAIRHVQGDPFADPSRFASDVAGGAAGLPAESFSGAVARRAAADFLHRRMAAVFGDASRRIGSGRGGRLHTPAPAAQVLARTAVLVSADGSVELRFRAGLPARGRRIMGEAAARLLCDTLPEALAGILPLDRHAAAPLLEHVRAVEDSVALRDALAERGLVAFVPDGAILPRRSGVDDAPLSLDAAVPFSSPAGLRVRLEGPHVGPITGMGIQRGVTLIVGGGYHGKSTLLRALELGVYDHPPGDGRERAVAVPGAMKIRAEDRRAVAATDISNFIGELPSGENTGAFSTLDASGSTSQAAAIAEALEAGATALLIDEDTSATNFMIRDDRMRALVAADAEPITPYIDRARQLFDDEGVSSILVVGGSGDYFDVADTVIAMRDYVPSEVTAEAHRIAAASPRTATPAPPWRAIRPHPSEVGRRGWVARARVRVPAVGRILFGRLELDLGAIEQLVDRSQTRAVALALQRLARGPDTARGLLMEAVQRLVEEVETGGLDVLQPHPTGELAEFRVLDLVAAFHRIRPEPSSGGAPPEE